ncbi:MAG: hypothetical protein ACFE8L_03955 [Candidatus Hodarchaeota archaeon]
MIFQGLFNILDLYLNDIEVFYNNVDNYFQHKIINSFGLVKIEKENIYQTLKDLTSFLVKEFVKLGFDQIEIENDFLDPFLELKDEDKENINSIVELFEKKFAPIIYETFLEKIVDYLVDIKVTPLMLKAKSEGFLPIEFIMELRNLKDFFERSPEKLENLRKYIQIREKIITKLIENKNKIESIEDLENPQDKLQLFYLIYRIIDFFHLQKRFDFSHIKEYLKNNVDEWLIDVPLITLKNPDIYFCGIYLAKQLNVDLDTEKVNQFLLNLYEEAVDEYEVPLIEATDGAYYYFKSTDLMELWLNEEQIENIISIDPKYFQPNYLKDFETSQLVVILKLYKFLEGKLLDHEIKAIADEIELRVSSEGIKQFRDGFVSSEATYYVLFCNYMRNTLEKLKDYALLDKIVSRIYRNLELIDFSIDTNYDLVSELFYSVESLKLFNCIETKQMIIHLAKYLFPEEIVKKISSSEDIISTTARFRHLKVNKITGETIY